MPVTKYRSAGNMPRPEPIGEAQLVSHIRALWRRAFLLCPRTRRRGVWRFKSIGEANTERQLETTERLRQRAFDSSQSLDPRARHRAPDPVPDPEPSPDSNQQS